MVCLPTLNIRWRWKLAMHMVLPHQWKWSLHTFLVLMVGIKGKTKEWQAWDPTCYKSSVYLSNFITQFNLWKLSTSIEIHVLFKGSQSITFTVPKDAPEDLRALDIDSRDVVLTWRPVRPDSVRGLLLGYKVWAGTISHARMYFNFCFSL